MRRKSSAPSAVFDPFCCPVCSKRVTIGVQCSGCSQWRHNVAPCTDPSECSAIFTPFFCKSCLEVVQRVEKTRKSFPTIASAQKWTAAPRESPLQPLRETGGCCEGSPTTSEAGGGQDFDKSAEQSIRSSATLQAVRTFVKAQKRHTVSITDNDEQEMIISSLVRVYSGISGDTSDDDDDETSSDDGDGNDNSTTGSSEEDWARGTTTSTRKRFAACTMTAQRRAMPRVISKLSSLLRDAENEDREDEILIDVRPEDLVKLEGRAGPQSGVSSGTPSRTISSQNLSALRKKNPDGYTGGGGNSSATGPSRSLLYMHRGGNEETLREHYQSAALTADSESARRMEQERKLATAKKLLDQHKRLLRQRYEQSQNQRSAHEITSRHRKGGGSLSQSTDPFESKVPLATHTRKVVEAHKRMYFADVPQASTATTPPMNSTLQQARNGRRKVDLANLAVRLSVLEEAQDGAGLGGSFGSDSANRYLLGDGGSDGGEASIAIRPGDLSFQDGWTAPF